MLKPFTTCIAKGKAHKKYEYGNNRGGRSKPNIKRVTISTPKPLKKSASVYQKRKTRRKFRRRAAIEPVIGHLKADFRMGQNYLNGRNSPKINAMLASTRWNLKKMTEKLIQELLHQYLLLKSRYFIRS